MILKLYNRQISLKALTIDHGGHMFFIPKTFKHKMMEDYLVDVEIPEWFEKKYHEELKEISIGTDLWIKRLRDE